VVGSREYGDELSGSGATELVSLFHQNCKTCNRQNYFLWPKGNRLNCVKAPEKSCFKISQL
jgi:hypothetical protein